ncbi:MAG: hypothetical protein PHT94_01560 [Candidatus Nanoarchaeia archaeon]|nr:hypothetical protein [Candidatus Nanoarchaeia archaeon]
MTMKLKNGLNNVLKFNIFFCLFKKKLFSVFLFFCFLFILINANNVYSDEYISVGLNYDYYRCIFNNTKIFVDVDQNGIEDYIFECNENYYLQFNVSPRFWSSNYSIKTTKPIIYYNRRIIKYFYLNNRYLISVFTYFTKFQKEKYKNEINLYEKGNYIFFSKNKINVTCENNSVIEIEYENDEKNIPCNFYYKGVFEGMPSDRRDMNSGNYFYIQYSNEIEFVGDGMVGFDFGSNGIIDDFLNVNHNKLMIPENTTIFTNKKMLLKGSDFIYYRIYYSPFKYFNATYYCDKELSDYLNKSKNFYKLERRISTPENILKKLDLDVTVFTKFKSYTDKTIEVIISNPTFDRIYFNFWYSINKNTKSITETIKDLRTDENLDYSNNFLEPFSYKKITIELENNFEIVNFNYGISYNELKFLEIN